MVYVSASLDKDAQSKGPLHVAPEDIEQDGSVDSQTVTRAASGIYSLHTLRIYVYTKPSTLSRRLTEAPRIAYGG